MPSPLSLHPPISWSCHLYFLYPKSDHLTQFVRYHLGEATLSHPRCYEDLLIALSAAIYTHTLVTTQLSRLPLKTESGLFFCFPIISHGLCPKSSLWSTSLCHELGHILTTSSITLPESFQSSHTFLGVPWDCSINFHFRVFESAVLSSLTPVSRKFSWLAPSFHTSFLKIEAFLNYLIKNSHPSITAPSS